jgi:tRNA A-37 threonylcarbamoyl transferase component Bud32/tetratricopeptide (TPR) repeat protein
MPCPDERTIAAFVSRSMSATVEINLESHVADCAECRQLAFALAGADAPPPGHEPSARIGRFEVVAPIGAGAMGRVFRARDPELGREVAVKVRHGHARLDLDGELRLRREAQALARLSHPNVVAVHEVGHDDGAVYVAMEYVEGPTLETWLETPRSVREIIDVMTSAGRGLAAAHAAGLVHRDVKPSNMFVTAGSSAKIGDFGLARADEAATETAGALSLDLVLPLSVTGALVGTPAYMAPEQLRGETATAASDQFGFCVTFYEALFGERPFRGASLHELMAAIARGTAVPARPRLPARLRRALVRGLDADPARRFPSMTALLASLPARGGATPWLAGGAAAALALVLAATQTRAADDPCAQPDPRASQTFGGDRVDRIAVTLAGDDPRGAPVAATVRRLLVDYGRRWDSTRTASCRAASSDALRDRQRACLERRLDRIEGLAAVLATAGTVRDDAARAVEDLPGPEACLRIDPRFADREPLPAGSVEIERRIDYLLDLGATGQASRAAGELDAVVAAARQTHAPRLIARALLAQADIYAATERFDELESLLADAAREAARDRDDELVAEAWVALLEALATHLGRIEDARRWVAVAESATLRAGDPPLLRAALHEQVSALLMESGQFDRAQAEIEAAMALRERAQPGASVTLAASHRAVALVLRRQGHRTEAREHLETALRLYHGALGDHHPEVIQTLSTLGSTIAEADPPRAAEYLEKARRLAEEVHGVDSAIVGRILTGLGIVRYHLRDYAAAAALHRRAATLLRARLGDRHRQVAYAIGNEGKALIALGDHAAAVAAYREVVALLAASLGPDDMILARARAGLGDALLRHGDLLAARAAYEQAIAAYDKAQDGGGEEAAMVRVDLGQLLVPMGETARGCSQLATAHAALAADPDPDRGYLVAALAGIVTCDTLAGRVDRARLAELDTAAAAPEIEAEVTARQDFARARAHAALGDRAKARALAAASRDAFVRASMPERRAEVERWSRALP